MIRIDLENIRKNKKFIEKFGLEEGEDFQPLGHGEYNINYTFNSKIHNRKLVLRIASASQMNLKKQIEYEYRALELLKNTGRTPGPIYYDASRKLIDYGFLVMDYLPGRALDYRSDLKTAAEILSDIHKEPIPCKNHLISPENPIEEMYKESRRMFEKFKLSDYGSREVKEKIEILLEKGSRIKTKDRGKRSIINTELNSGNFLINDKGQKSYLVDWEKPLYGYPAQDLGHFLAPTTTFWKTDSILSPEDTSFFIREYCRNMGEARDGDEFLQSVSSYISMNCLRGLTWCAMAYADYQNPDKLLTDEYTLEKIKAYLSPEFLDMIRDRYLNEY